MVVEVMVAVEVMAVVAEAVAEDHRLAEEEDKNNKNTNIYVIAQIS